MKTIRVLKPVEEAKEVEVKLNFDLPEYLYEVYKGFDVWKAYKYKYQSTKLTNDSQYPYLSCYSGLKYVYHDEDTIHYNGLRETIQQAIDVKVKDNNAIIRTHERDISEIHWRIEKIKAIKEAEEM